MLDSFTPVWGRLPIWPRFFSDESQETTRSVWQCWMIFHLVGNMCGCMTDRVWHSRIVGNIVWFIILLAWRYDDFWPTPVFIMIFYLYVNTCLNACMFCFLDILLVSIISHLIYVNAKLQAWTWQKEAPWQEQKKLEEHFQQAVQSCVGCCCSPRYHPKSTTVFPMKTNIYIHYKMDTRPESFIDSSCFFATIRYIPLYLRTCN